MVKNVIASDGLAGLFGRGLSTKLISNGVQGLMFSVLWRLGQDMMVKYEVRVRVYGCRGGVWRGGSAGRGGYVIGWRGSARGRDFWKGVGGD